MNYRVLIAATLVAAVANASEVDPKLPSSWFKNGAPPAAEVCEAGVDAQLEARGTRNITLRCEASTKASSARCRCSRPRATAGSAFASPR